MPPATARLRPVERAGYAIAALLFLSGMAHVVLLLAAGGTWEGPLSLRKPATFGLSFGLTLATIVWTSSFLELQPKTRQRLLGLFAAACALETLLVSLQAWRGVPSHFNMETRLDATIAQLLAIGGATLVVIIGALMRAAYRRQPGLAPSMRVALRVGFVTLFAALVVGGVMIARGVTLVIGGNAALAYSMGGALKPSHAVTMHGILMVPLLARVLMLTPSPEQRRLAIVRAASAVYLLICVIVIVANLSGAM
jgi:hypothetical protein